MKEQGNETRDLPLLLKVGHEIHSEMDKERLLDKSITAIVDALEASDGSIMLLDEDSGELRIAAAKALDTALVQNTRQKLGEGIAGWVAKTKEPLLLKGAVQSPNFNGVNPDIAEALSVPIEIKGRVLGVVNVRNMEGDQKADLSESDLETLKVIAGELAIAINHADLFKQAEEQARQALALYGLSRAVCSVLQPHDTVDIVLDMIAGQIESSALLMIQPDERDQGLLYRSSRGLTPPVTPGEPVANQAEIDLFAAAMKKGTPQSYSASEL
ncbi:MAG: GAF domain-containing protein, partial [Chloroflexota bacterium]